MSYKESTPSHDSPTFLPKLVRQICAVASKISEPCTCNKSNRPKHAIAQICPQSCITQMNLHASMAQYMTSSKVSSTKRLYCWPPTLPSQEIFTPKNMYNVTIISQWLFRQCTVDGTSLRSCILKARGPQVRRPSTSCSCHGQPRPLKKTLRPRSQA
jgi:hypothetical protein